jgi:hypothetical protein
MYYYLCILKYALKSIYIYVDELYYFFIYLYSYLHTYTGKLFECMSYLIKYQLHRLTEEAGSMRKYYGPLLGHTAGLDICICVCIYMYLWYAYKYICVYAY